MEAIKDFMMGIGFLGLVALIFGVIFGKVKDTIQDWFGDKQNSESTEVE